MLLTRFPWSSIRYKHQSGIIYCRARKTGENMAQFLKERGIEAHFYHAGMPKDDRARVAEDWQENITQVVVATVGLFTTCHLSFYPFALVIHFPPFTSHPFFIASYADNILCRLRSEWGSISQMVCYGCFRETGMVKLTGLCYSAICDPLRYAQVYLWVSPLLSSIPGGRNSCIH